MAARRRDKQFFDRVAGPALAKRFGLSEDGRGRLVGAVRGFDVRVEVINESGGGEFGNSTIRTVLAATLPGWPTTSQLTLRVLQGSARRGGLPIPSAANFRRLPLIRRRYIRFDDPAWDDAFIVMGRDRDLIRLHLDGRRRMAVQEAAVRVRSRGRIEQPGYMGWQYHHQVGDGRLSTYFSDVFTDTDVISQELELLVDLAVTLTG